MPLVIKFFSRRLIGMSLGVTVLGSVSSFAASFQWADGDLLLGFRQVGGASELILDLGRATNWNQWATTHPGVTTNVTPALFTNAFSSSFSNIFWSAFAANATADHNIWATKPRVDVQLQSTPWIGRTSLGQAAGLNPIHATGANALSYSASSIPRAVQTGAEVILPLGLNGGYQYEVTVNNRDLYGAHFGYVGFSDGSVGVENNTPGDFDLVQVTNRLDFYYIPAVSDQGGKFLGYFDLVSGGTVFFTAATAPPGLSAAAPSTGPTAGGTLVTLTGSNFANGLTVRFSDSIAPTVNFSNSTLISVVAPPNNSGTANIMVINPDGQSAILANGFTYTGGSNPPPPAPTFKSIVQSGSSIVLVSSGATNRISQVLSSTDPAASVSSWASVATNAVGPDGLFTNVLSIATGDHQRFYRLAIPYP